MDSYVSLKDRAALEAIRDHRLQLLKQLSDQQPGWMDPTSTIQLLDEDLLAVESRLAGVALARLVRR